MQDFCALLTNIIILFKQLIVILIINTDVRMLQQSIVK